jgi:hypothetical protein
LGQAVDDGKEADGSSFCFPPSSVLGAAGKFVGEIEDPIFLPDIFLLDSKQKNVRQKNEGKKLLSLTLRQTLR